MSDQGQIDLNVTFKDDTVVHIQITGYKKPLHVVKALEKLGRFEYLDGLYNALVGGEDEEWEDEIV